jgi:hypothetical protein
VPEARLLDAAQCKLHLVSGEDGTVNSLSYYERQIDIFDVDAKKWRPIEASRGLV